MRPHISLIYWMHHHTEYTHLTRHAVRSCFFPEFHFQRNETQIAEEEEEKEKPEYEQCAIKTSFNIAQSVLILSALLAYARFSLLISFSPLFLR